MCLRVHLVGNGLCQASITVTLTLCSHLILIVLDLTFVFGGSKVRLYWQRLLATHVLCLHNALQWMSDLQLDNDDFESDSKIAFDVVHATRDDISEFGYIISSCRSLFSFFLQTLGWSLPCNKQTRLLMCSQEKSHY